MITANKNATRTAASGDHARIANSHRPGDECRVRKGFDGGEARPAPEPQLLPGHAEALAGSVVEDTRGRLVALQELHQRRIVVLHPRRRTALKGELAVWVGMQKEIARLVDDVDAAPLTRGGANAIEYRPQVEVGDHDSEPASAAISGAATHGRNAGASDPARLLELDRRDVNVAGRKRDRLLEVVLITVVLQLRLGRGTACATFSRPPSATPTIRHSSYQDLAVSSAENRDVSWRRSAAAKTFEASAISPEPPLTICSTAKASTSARAARTTA